MHVLQRNGLGVLVSHPLQGVGSQVKGVPDRGDTTSRGGSVGDEARKVRQMTREGDT